MEGSISWSHSFQTSFTKFCEGFLRIPNNDHVKSDTDIIMNDVPMNLQYFETDLDIYIDSCFRTTALSW